MTDQGSMSPNVTEAGDSTDSDGECCPDIVPDDTTNKICVVKEMFHDVDDEKIVCLLNLLNGNVHKVVSVCLEGLTIRTILRVFRSSKMLTRVKKVVVREDCMLQDALSLYKAPNFNVAKPIEIEIIGSQVVDLGGPRKQFFGRLLEGLAKNEVLQLFEGDCDSGYLLPAVNHDAILCGHFKMLGRIIVHSILLEGPGFPLFPLPIYQYIVEGTVESALAYMDIRYLPPRVRVVVDQVR